MKRPVTIKDIARELNISATTVSRALRGTYDVNASTRQAVMEMAKKLDYSPNFYARSLVNQKSYTIGVSLPNISANFFSLVMNGIYSVVNKEGYRVIFSNNDDKFEQELNDMSLFLSNKVDGLLIAPSNETQNYKHLQSVVDNGIPMVFFDRYIESVDVSRVVVDDYAGAYQVVEHMIRGGCRRIAHLSGPENLVVCKNRRRGYEDALRDYGFQVDENLIMNTDFFDRKVTEVTNKLIDQEPMPDGIFAVNDQVAITALRLLKERNFQVPEGIAVAGFTNLPYTDLINPSLTTVSQPAYQIGARAAELLIQQIKDDKSTTSVIEVLPTELVVRDSTRKVPSEIY